MACRSQQDTDMFFCSKTKMEADREAHRFECEYVWIESFSSKPTTVFWFNIFSSQNTGLSVPFSRKFLPNQRPLASGKFFGANAPYARPTTACFGSARRAYPGGSRPGRFTSFDRNGGFCTPKLFGNKNANLLENNDQNCPGDPNDEVFGHCFVWFFSAKIEDKEVPGLYIYTLPPTRSTKFVPEKWWLVEMIHFILELSVFWGHVTFHGGGISLYSIFSTQKMLARGKWRLRQMFHVMLVTGILWVGG